MYQCLLYETFSVHKHRNTEEEIQFWWTMRTPLYLGRNRNGRCRRLSSLRVIAVHAHLIDTHDTYTFTLEFHCLFIFCWCFLFLVFGFLPKYALSFTELYATIFVNVIVHVCHRYIDIHSIVSHCQTREASKMRDSERGLHQIKINKKKHITNMVKCSVESDNETKRI